MEDERTYKIMRGTGAVNLAAGIIAIVTGVTLGILLIISGSKLLAQKGKLFF